VSKIIVLNRISLDGYFAGVNGEIDWFIPDPEVDKAAHQMMHADTLLLGRITYQLFESHWPHVAEDPNAPEAARRTANELSQMNKIVFSRTMQQVSWENTRPVKTNILDAVRELHEGKQTDTAIFGSGSIVQQLANADLIDKYLLIVTPVILGSGKPMFAGVKKMDLELLETMSFASGNVLLQYAA